MRKTSSLQIILPELQQIAEQAFRNPEMVFTTLMHHVNVDFLWEAYLRVKKDRAAGVDKMTGREYARDLKANLRDLHERLRSGRYVAPPVRRIWLDKEGGKKRPIGIPCFEDKIVQRAVAMLMNAIYEQDFYDFSYGFREGRSAHQALHDLREWCKYGDYPWILDADISGFFDNIDRTWLIKIIKRRINDGAMIRLIGKWLNAGVQEGEGISYPDSGTPQGGVISPVLANIFLNVVMDEWFSNEVQHRLKGKSFMIRYADDFICGFEYEADARTVMEVLPKRFGRFGLTIHPEKTHLVNFSRPSRRDKRAGNDTFDLLGFTHYWDKARQGFWVIKRKTMKNRLRRTLRAIWVWCRDNRNLKLEQQHRILRSKINGHNQYYGIRCNCEMLKIVYDGALHAWQYWLSQRSHKSHIPWDKFKAKILNRFPLPTPRVIHVI